MYDLSIPYIDSGTNNEPRHCLWCRELLPPLSHGGVQFFCSIHCQRQGYRANLRPQMGYQAEQILPTCHAVFHSCYPIVVYCSGACRQTNPTTAAERAAKMRDYRWEKPDIMQAIESQRYEHCYDKRLRRQKDYYARYREERRAYNRAWNAAHPDYERNRTKRQKRGVK